MITRRLVRATAVVAFAISSHYIANIAMLKRCAMAITAFWDATEPDTFCMAMNESVKSTVNNIRSEMVLAIRSGETFQQKATALGACAQKYSGTIIRHTPTVNGKPVSKMEAVAAYIHGEMMRNISSIDHAKLRALLEFPDGDPAFDRLPAIILANRTSSYLHWVSLVNYGKRWDHKPIIQTQYGLWSYDPELTMLFAHDIWSNIHYAFIGAAAGFMAFELKLGAAVANMKNGLLKVITEYGGLDDPADQSAIAIGLDLFEIYGSKFSVDNLLEIVRGRASELSTLRCNYLDISR